MKINLKEIEVGDVFSEESHYVALEVGSDRVRLKHLESGEIVSLGHSYIAELLNTADQYQSEVKVTKEDKKDGTKGIRSIFEGIHSSQVFTVCFTKQDKPLSAKRLKELKEAQISTAIEKIEKAQKAKKGVLEAAKQELIDIQNNSILPYEEGEERVLRGYKVQFDSRDGKYMCIDMDLVKTDKEDTKRLVNINTIKWIVIGGIKYVVE